MFKLVPQVAPIVIPVVIPRGAPQVPARVTRGRDKARHRTSPPDLSSLKAQVAIPDVARPEVVRPKVVLPEAVRPEIIRPEVEFQLASFKGRASRLNSQFSRLWPETLRSNRHGPSFKPRSVRLASTAHTRFYGEVLLQNPPLGKSDPGTQGIWGEDLLKNANKRGISESMSDSM